MKLRFTTYGSFLALVGFALSAATTSIPQGLPIRSQSDTAKLQTPDGKPRPEAILAYEAGNDGNPDSSGYFTRDALDDLATELTGSADAKAVVIAYGPEGKHRGTAEFILAQVKTYLEKRMIDSKRILTVNGGLGVRIREVGLELWVVPPGAEIPKPAANQFDIEHYSGMVGLYAEHAVRDADEAECCGLSHDLALVAAFAQILRHQPDAVGHLVVYQTPDLAPDGWRQIGQQYIQLCKEYGIDPDRLKISRGGWSGGAFAQLWVLPKNQALPMKTDSD